jgi:hypothetical protein
LAYLPSGLYEFPKSTLPNGKVHIANSAFPSYQLHITTATLSNCQVHFTLWTARMSFKLPPPQIKKFWTNALVFIWSAQTLVQNSDCPSFFSFFHRLPRLTCHPPPPCLSASFWLNNWAMWILPSGKMDLKIGQCGF